MGKTFKGINVNLKKLLRMSLVINIIHIILIAISIIYLVIKPSEELYILFYISAILTTFSSTLTAMSYYFIIYIGKNNTLETIKNLEALNMTLREQRHDYLNHMQVVYGLMELKEYDEAEKYMESVCLEIFKVNRALKTAHPAVNALLQAKLQMAETKNIHMYLEIKSDLKHMMIEPWELCKVLSNIIDNGITALQERSENRKLYIDIMEQEAGYKVDIYNNGPKIKEEIVAHLFEGEFSTKAEPGHGMGLYIVKRIIQKVGGEIKLVSTEENTHFKIQLPKYKSEK